MSACEEAAITFEDVLSTANQRRANIARPSEDRLLELIQIQEPLNEPVDLSRFTERGDSLVWITSDEAIYDVQTFFALLRDVYGAYTYFGGDAVFVPVMNDIIEELSEREQWAMPLFTQILLENLSQVIEDNHFWLYNQPLGIEYHFYIWEEPFDKTNNGFRHRESGRYVIEVVGFDKYDVFRLTMDEEGDFFYMPIVAQNSLGESVSLFTFHIIFDDGEEERLLLNQNWQRLNYEESSLRFEGDIPIVTIRAMGFPDVFDEEKDILDNQSARNFLLFAEQLQDEPVVIIDIRSNFGGNGFLAPMWLHRLTGEIVPRNFFGLTRIDSYIAPQEWYDLWYIPDEDLQTYLTYEALGDYHTLSYTNPYRVVPNEQLLILLVDSYTASAGDDFADLVLSLENTLIIGQNTAGMLLTNSFAINMYLPYSGVPFTFGPTLFVHSEGHLPEGLGIAPDIWVMGDALTAALAMLERGF